MSRSWVLKLFIFIPRAMTAVTAPVGDFAALVQSCEKCHNANGSKPVDDAAILAVQWTPYLRSQFDNFLSGKHVVPRTILRRIKKLSKEDIEGLHNFYASEGMRNRVSE